ncbi:helix-turn-helix domain-containing protein [Synechocystis sp. PCC 7509]|uniref:helix-turn-helix domain-containing protein n=1 Tax=Synechocystis sp. PCC 7509 TaxID=927677 RepID=UPI0002AC5CBD|nr:helix-turn-helix domain-containing protein [Synechocystis sp. PCC 7509]
MAKSDNLESLEDKRQKGNHRKATKKYIELLLEVVERPPQELGYEFGKWTGERLSIYLQQQTGIKLNSKQISRILQKKLRLHLGKVQLRI